MTTQIQGSLYHYTVFNTVKNLKPYSRLLMALKIKKVSYIEIYSKEYVSNCARGRRELVSGRMLYVEGLDWDFVMKNSSKNTVLCFCLMRVIILSWIYAPYPSFLLACITHLVRCASLNHKCSKFHVPLDIHLYKFNFSYPIFASYKIWLHFYC